MKVCQQGFKEIARYLAEHAMFASIDTDGSGEVSLSELNRIETGRANKHAQVQSNVRVAELEAKVEFF